MTYYTLVGSDGHPYLSAAPGTLGGHRRGRIYGRLDCRAARRAIARGGYVQDRVFFAGECDAVAAPDGRLLIITNNTDGRGDPRAGDDHLYAVTLGPRG